MLYYLLSLCALPLLALLRHVVTQRSKTVRFSLALQHTTAAERTLIIQACTEFETGRLTRPASAR